MIEVPHCGHWCCAHMKHPPVEGPTCNLDLPPDHPDHRDQHPDEELGLDYCPGCDGALQMMEAPE